jgi:hypothetical protein
MRSFTGLFLGTSVAATAANPRWVLQPDSANVDVISFNNTWAGGLPGLNTHISASFDGAALTLTYDVQNSAVQKNAYDVCNEDVFNQEVVEVFITGEGVGAAKPEKYYEVELTPAGTPWVGLDSNPGGDRANLTHVLQRCDAVGTAILARDLRGAGSWRGEIRLPYALIGRGAAQPDGSRLYRANFFRVTMNPAPWAPVAGRVTRDMGCDPSNCTYTCANCPGTAAPDFHHSGYFGELVLAAAAKVAKA